MSYLLKSGLIAASAKMTVLLLQEKREWALGRQLEVASKVSSGQNSSIEKQHWNKVDALT